MMKLWNSLEFFNIFNYPRELNELNVQTTMDFNLIIQTRENEIKEMVAECDQLDDEITIVIKNQQEMVKNIRKRIKDKNVQISKYVDEVSVLKNSIDIGNKFYAENAEEPEEPEESTESTEEPEEPEEEISPATKRLRICKKGHKRCTGCDSEIPARTKFCNICNHQAY